MTTASQSRRGLLTRMRQSTSDFFYAREVPYGLALIRMVLPLVILIPLLQRWPHVRELYSADGAPSQLSRGYGMGNVLPELPAAVAVALFGLMVFTLLTTAAGWRTRLSLIIATVLYTYFNFIDAISTLTKYSVLATDVLLVLCLSHCGSVWSVDAWLRRSAGAADLSERPRSAVWPRRLIQILLGFLYFGSVATKIQVPEFFTGDHLRYWIFTNVNHPKPLGEFFAMYPPVLVLLAYVVACWEGLFVFLAWRGRSRVWTLGLGVLFHAGTWLLLGLHIFPMVCVALYAAFLRESDAERCRVALGRWTARLERVMRTPRAVTVGRARLVPASLPVYLLLATGVSVCAVEIEYRSDPYGLRRTEGSWELPEMDRETALSMIRDEGELRLTDKFFAFDLGSLAGTEMLANFKSQFDHGQTIVAQATMNPPFEDMWLECCLCDSEDQIVLRESNLVHRKAMRTLFRFEACNALEPGEYWMILRAYGHEIMRRPFQITGSSPADPSMRPVAN